MRPSPIAAGAVLLAVLHLMAPAFAQVQAPDSSRPSCRSTAATLTDLLADSQRLLDASNHAEAAACFERAAARASEQQLRAEQARARLGLGQSLYYLADYPRAEEAADLAIALFDQAGEALDSARATRLKASIRNYRGDRATARKLYEDASRRFEALGAGQDRAIALLGLATLLTDPAEKIATLDTGLALAREAGDAKAEGRLLASRADTRFSTGRFDEAVVDLATAIERLKAANDRTGIADSYVSLGRIYRAHGDPERAILYYDRAIALQQEGGDLRSLVQSVNAKAIALAALGRLAEARREYEREVEIARGTGSERIVTFAEGNLAPAYAEAGEHEKAVEMLERVIAREQSAYVLAYRHAVIAQSYASLRRFDEALQHAEKAVALARQSNNRDYLPRVLFRRADVERRAGRTDDALAHAREAVAAIEGLRARLVPLDFMKQGFAEVHQSVFGLTIALMLDRGLDADALVASEQARARAFLDLLASRDLVGRPASAPTPAAGEIAPGGHLTLASYASSSPASAQEIAATARRLRSSIVSYWINPDELFIWVTAPDGTVRSARVAVASTALDEAVDGVDPASGKAGDRPFSRLYTLLVAPVAKYLPPPGGSLTIVPHGALFRVPFAALRDARAGRYLIERYAISYAPSISSFALTERLAGRASSSNGVLLVADPASMGGASRDDLPPLAGSLREAAAIGRIFASSRTVVLSGSGALEPIVRRTFPGKAVVHFATHAVANDAAPLDSYLALGAVGPEAAADGRLTAREIYDLSLEARLVFLSGCRTATGKVSGDGIAGLSRALFYAGTPSVIATLWDVADEPSVKLVTDFYTAWKRGLDKRAALRDAQLRMIKALRGGTLVARAPGGAVLLSNKPFYWASYILVGEP